MAALDLLKREKGETFTSTMVEKALIDMLDAIDRGDHAILLYLPQKYAGSTTLHLAEATVDRLNAAAKTINTLRPNLIRLAVTLMLADYQPANR